MKLSNKFMLACEGVMTKKARAFMLGFGVSVGTAALIFLVSLIFGAKTYVDTKVGEIRENLLNIYEKKPPPANPRPLNEDAVAQLHRVSQGVEIDAKVYRELPVQPSPYIKIKDNPRFKVLKIVGMDKELFANKFGNSVPKFTHRPVEPVDEREATFPEYRASDADENDTNFVPVIVPNIFAEALRTLAGADPQIRDLLENLVRGQQPFYVVLDDGKAYRCKVVAEDNLVESFSLAVPIEYAQQWNEQQKEFRASETMPDYSRLVMEVKDVKDLDVIKEEIVAAGYQPEPTEAQKLSIGVNRSATYLFLVAVTFCLVIALVSAIGIFNGLSISIMEQASRIGILRSVGATRRDISATYLIEAAIIGIVGGVIGLVAAHLLMWGSDIALKDFLSDVTNIRDIDTLFAWNFSLAFFIRIGAIGLGVVTSILAGVGPAYRASRLNPAVVLREG